MSVFWVKTGNAGVWLDLGVQTDDAIGAAVLFRRHLALPSIPPQSRMNSKCVSTPQSRSSRKRWRHPSKTELRATHRSVGKRKR